MKLGYQEMIPKDFFQIKEMILSELYDFWFEMTSKRDWLTIMSVMAF